MPLSEADQAKVNRLQALIIANGAVMVSELVAVQWPAPDGVIYYCSTQLNELPGYGGLTARALNIETRFAGNQFLDIAQDSGISDDKVDLVFWDGDEHDSSGALVRTSELTRLFQTHGAGVKVDIFYYFPEVDLLLRQWWGHLQPPSDASLDWFKTSAEFGFMSSMLPLPRRAFFSSCGAMFGGLLPTQGEIDDNDCPYNKHLGGATGLLDPGTGLPFTSCPRNNRTVCIARLGDDLSYLGMDTVIQSYTVNQTRGPAITTTTRGNENNLKRPLRVIAGQRHVTDLDLLAYAIEPDTKHPEGGAVTCLFAETEGPIEAQANQMINSVTIGAQHLNARNGERRQARTGFSKSVSNYSGTALFFGRAQGDFTKITADQLKGECDVRGLKDVRVYSDAVTFVEQYSSDRAWWLMHIERNKRWGQGIDVARLYIPDYINLSTWWAETVTVTDKDGNTTTGPRSQFHAELIDRTAQQQISDLCLAGRCSVPFPDDSGQMRVLPLRRVTSDDLAAAPVFTDYGEDRTIVWEGPPGEEKTTFTYSILSDAELPNRVIVTYDDATHNNAQVPLTFEDVDQQLKAGRVFGDISRRAVEKTYTAFGVTDVGECGRLGNLLLDLGEFDEGGLKNNLRVQFTTWWTFAVELQKYQVVKVRSAKLDVINAIRVDQGLERFDYFRVRTKRRLPTLKVELSLQGYPVGYYERLESSELPPPIVPSFPDQNPGGGGGRLPYKVTLLSLGHTDDRINFELDQPTIP